MRSCTGETRAVGTRLGWWNVTTSSNDTACWADVAIRAVAVLHDQDLAVGGALGAFVG